MLARSPARADGARGATRGYTRHPQLERFRDGPEPLALVGAYLAGVAEEAERRRYRFDRGRIRVEAEPAGQLSVTEGQLALEWGHLLAKLATRSPDDAARWRDAAPQAHPLFRVVPGSVEVCEPPTSDTPERSSLFVA